MAKRRTLKIRTGEKIGSWKLVKRIGQGGNGEVWEAEKPGEQNRAIKILKRIDAVSMARFEAETNALKMAQAVPGIVPLLEKGTVKLHAREVPWFSMPLAGTFNSLMAKRSAREIVAEFEKLADTLAALHDLEIFHRDIKPANILVLDGRLCFSDFGLVKYPQRADLTPKKQDVGPKFTMAPEMRRFAADAKGGPADIFSFAKTLWIALTGERLSFDGQYLATGSLALARYKKDLHTTPLDELLSECTDNDPGVRPGAHDVRDRLNRWLGLMEDFFKRNLSEWTEIQNRLFPGGSPASVTWTDIDSICSVLRLAGQNDSLNHMFFPDGGGMTMSGASRSASDPELIELRTGFLTVVRPAKLTFESFAAGSQWNYFRLETRPLHPTGAEGAYIRADEYAEEVYELAPGRYAGPDAWENGEFDDDPDSPNARKMSRYLKGCFVIFSTASPYNQTPETYDARHEKMSEEEFRAYMQKSADHALAATDEAAPVAGA